MPAPREERNKQVCIYWPLSVLPCLSSGAGRAESARSQPISDRRANYTSSNRDLDPPRFLQQKKPIVFGSPRGSPTTWAHIYPFSNRSRLTYSSQGGKITSIAMCENSHSIVSASDSGSIHVFKIECAGKREVSISTTKFSTTEQILGSLVAYLRKDRVRPENPRHNSWTSNSAIWHIGFLGTFHTTEVRTDKLL